MYSKILNQAKMRTPIEIRAIDLRVRSETGGLSDLVYKWNREAVFRALEETREYLGRDDLVYMVRGALAQDPRGPSRSFHPDWAATALNSHGLANGSLAENFLPGDTKYSKNWKSAWVKEGECESMVGPQGVYPEWFWPVAQVFTYCYRLETRYAYIITDEELVLFRVGPNKKPPNASPRLLRLDIEEVGSDGKIEFVSVPWTNGRDEAGNELGASIGLSINTALWWIHLQAANNNSIQWAYPRLEDEVLPSRNDSCRSSGVDDQIERAPGVENLGHQEDPPLSSLSEVDNQTERSPSAETIGHQEDLPTFSFSCQQETEFAIPESSVVGIGGGSKRRKIDRKRTASPSASTPNASFASQSSATSGKDRVAKTIGRSAKRATRASSNAGSRGRGSGKK